MNVAEMYLGLSSQDEGKGENKGSVHIHLSLFPNGRCSMTNCSISHSRSFPRHDGWDLKCAAQIHPSLLSCHGQIFCHSIVTVTNTLLTMPFIFKTENSLAYWRIWSDKIIFNYLLFYGKFSYKVQKQHSFAFKVGITKWKLVGI